MNSSAQPEVTLLQSVVLVHVGGGSTSTSPNNLEGTDPALDLEAAITSSEFMEGRRREETSRLRMSADMYEAAKSNNVGYFRRLQGSSRSVDDVVDDVLASITLPPFSTARR